MDTRNRYNIAISVETRFLDDESRPEEGRYAFAYTVTIANRGSVGATLLSRHWVITDESGNAREVRGEGVAGEQPSINPGESWTYTSGAVLETDLATMQGSYGMLADDGTRFDAPIAAFVLSTPRTLH